MNTDSLFTLAVHAGERTTRPDFIPVVTPVYHSSSFIYDEMSTLDGVFAGTHAGPVYARYGNPTNGALERAVAALEYGEAALTYGSGMAALHGALLAAGARNGCKVVAAQDLYGATFALLNRLLPTQGVNTHFVDVTDLSLLEAKLDEIRPGVVLVETVSNPLLKVADIARIAELTHALGGCLVVDNTFATPILCRPLALGADYVVHSATKYLGGHGDVLGGVVVTSAERYAELYELHKLTGGVLGPQDAWLIHRGIKTLPLRVERQCANALEVVAWLAEHPSVAHVNFPGLPSHPQHDLARRCFGGKWFGAMISFALQRPDREMAFRFMDSLRMVAPATTLGDVYSLVLHPATSSHRALTAETREQFGISEGLIRLSVGIEEPADIISDIDQALRALGT